MRDSPNIKYTNICKDKIQSKQRDMSRQGFTSLARRGQNAEEDNDDLCLSLPAA